MNTLAILIKYDEHKIQTRKECNFTLLRNKIMDLRDERIRLQRKVTILEDKLFWEPEAFSDVDRRWLACYKSNIEDIKAKEQMLRNQMSI